MVTLLKQVWWVKGLVVTGVSETVVGGSVENLFVSRWSKGRWTASRWVGGCFSGVGGFVIYTQLFAWCALFKVTVFLLFCSCLSPLRNLLLLSTTVAQMMLTPRWVSRRKRYEITVHKYIITKRWNKHFISSRTKFSPNFHLVEEANSFPFFAPWYGLKWATKNKPIVSLVISILKFAFSLWLYNLV